MGRITVARLNLAVPRMEAAPLARFRLEEALHCAGDAAGERLLLIRRLRLGRLPGGELSQVAWNCRVEARLRELEHSALHAFNPGAEAAEAVFFRSALEARAGLIALLIAGRRPQAWFWPLAVPGWTGAAWAEAAPILLPDLAAQPGGVLALARLVRAALEEGSVMTMLRPLSASLIAALSPLPPAPAAPAAVPPMPPPGALGAGASGVSAPSATGEGADLPMARILAGLAPATRATLHRVLRDPGWPPDLRRFLVLQLLLAAEPQRLAAPPPQLTALVEAILGHLLSPPAAEETQPGPDAGTPRSITASRRAATQADADPVTTLPTGTMGPASERAQEAWAFSERRSAGAGLFLLIRPLALMGFATWLERHPDALAGGFAVALLHHIAIRQRISPEDALWHFLPPMPAEAPVHWLDAWRVGLDRWLRRHPRRRLAEVVRRPGWLRGDAEVLSIRFAVEAADIRLRRLALDVDPGWVPWLGRNLVYVYADRVWP